MNYIIVFLVIHIIISMAYFAWWFRRNREEAIYRLSVVLTMPVVGILLLLVVDFLVHKYKNVENIAELVGIDRHFQKEYFVESDFTKETNIIPFEEALILSPGSAKRQLIIDALKKDIESYVVMLEKALRDQDTETSHYAASAIMEIRRKLTIAIQEFGVKYEQAKDDPVVVMGYASVLKRYLRGGFLDERTYLKYQYTYFNVLKNTLAFPSAEADHYIDKINCDLDLKDYAAAYEDCNQFQNRYPDSEDSYLMKMKLYYCVHDIKMLNKVVDEFKKSEIRFSNNALNMVRYWSEGNQ